MLVPVSAPSPGDPQPAPSSDRADSVRTRILARALRVDQRLGSIEAGKDADLVFLNGDPLNMTSRVERVMVDGKVVYDGK